MKKQIVNIIFFLRNSEPRIPELDLFDCMRNQSALAEKYGYPVTFLLEYDSLVDDRYVKLLSNRGNCEIGGWFEIVEPLVKAAGIAWRGRPNYPWDWHCNVGFSVAYSQEERRRLVDAYMATFKEKFGYYPKTMGSWTIDSYSLEYMHSKYGVVGSTICREQWGTDGYTLWGGYYGQAYYPSRYNTLCPGNTKDGQINVPTFRMLGIDPLVQYDLGIEKSPDFSPVSWQSCATLEPLYSNEDIGAGGNPKWVDWFMRENFTPNTLSFNYVHVGQENSFLWEEQEKGTIYQFDKLKEMLENGAVELQTVSETAQWFVSEYDITPASSINALDDWKNGGKRSLWYSCRNYRCNLYSDAEYVWFRDLQLFREDYRERYYNDRCLTEGMIYDNLPMVDGNRWSGKGIRAGLYISYEKDGEFVPLTDGGVNPVCGDDGVESIEVTAKDGEKVNITLAEDGIIIKCNRKIRLELKGVANKLPHIRINCERIDMWHNAYDYAAKFVGGEVTAVENGIVITADGALTIKTDER